MKPYGLKKKHANLCFCCNKQYEKEVSKSRETIKEESNVICRCNKNGDSGIINPCEVCDEY